MYHPTEIFNSDIKKITSKAEICLQPEPKNIVFSEILSEWTFLKLKLAKWSRNDFPPESWESTAIKFDGLSNLFGLTDYFLTLSVSSAKAEHGFSILKSLKSSKWAVLTNQRFQQQMLVNIDRPKIESFKPQKSINYWYKHSSSKHRDGKAHAKQPAHGNKPQKKPGPKPKQTKLNFVTI